MAWSTPLTAVSSATLTSSQWNASVRDNLLETGPAKVTAAGQILVSTGANALAARTPTSASISTAETTTSTSYANLATVGPSVTVTTGTKALVFTTSRLEITTATASCYHSFAVSGATTLAAADDYSVEFQPEGASRHHRGTAAHLISLTAGSNTFTMQYKVTAGTGTFGRRHIIVVPL